MAGLGTASDDAVQQAVGPEGAKQVSHRKLERRLRPGDLNRYGSTETHASSSPGARESHPAARAWGVKQAHP